MPSTGMRASSASSGPGVTPSAWSALLAWQASSASVATSSCPVVIGLRPASRRARCMASTSAGERSESGAEPFGM